MSRVLVVSAEPIGERMAGPAIRAVELARALARGGCAVTLAAPGGAPVDGVARLAAGLEDYDALSAPPRATTSSSPSCCRRGC